MLELADGGTLITSASRLRESLARSQPDWLDADGSIPFEKLRAEGAAAQRGFGEAVGGLVSKVFTLVAGEKKDAIIDAALDWLKERGLKPAELGVSWAGTQALMWAIESRLMKAPGRLYRWVGASGKAADLEPPRPADLARGSGRPAADAGVPARHRVELARQLRRTARRRSRCCGRRSKSTSATTSSPSSTTRCRPARSKTRCSWPGPCPRARA